MEIALRHDWYEGLNPGLREKWDAFQERKAKDHLELWERVKLGEKLPNKIYMPVPYKEGVKCEL